MDTVFSLEVVVMRHPKEQEVHERASFSGLDYSSCCITLNVFLSWYWYLYRLAGILSDL